MSKPDYSELERVYQRSLRIKSGIPVEEYPYPGKRWLDPKLPPGARLFSFGGTIDGRWLAEFEHNGENYHAILKERPSL